MAATGRTNAPSPRASWARPPEPRAERRPGVVAAPGCPSATTVTQRQTPSNALPCAFAPLRLSVALLPFALCACWSQQPAAARADYQQAQKNAEALQKQGQFREAITACEAFMRAHPDATAGCQLFLAEKALANLVDRILLRDIKERDQTVPICEAAVKEFEGVPYYWAVCAKYVIQAKMWRAGEQGAAADLANQVVEKLGDRLPPGYVGASLLMFHVYALRNAGRFDEALEAAKKDAKLRPLLLSNDEFFQALYGAVSGAKKPDQLLSVAKLAFVLSDFQEGSLTRATELVTKALTATQGPGVAIQFARSQEDATAPNPLKHVPLLDLGDGKAIVAAAAENDTDGRFNALLYAGDVRQAVELAKEQLRTSAGVDFRMATALRNLARCFKAHDLNLIRANQFLEFHRTGAGVNPLPELEGELANAVTP